MGMFDRICDVPVRCPICGDENGKAVQIKSGPQTLANYKFGEDKISLNWNYNCYGSVIEQIDDENGKIRGIAECKECRDRVSKKMKEIIQRYKDADKIKRPERREGDIAYLFECEIDGKNALKVVLADLDKIYGKNSDSEYFFDVVITIKDSIAVGVEIINEGKYEDISDRR